jgi:hypothetical protein
VRERYNDGSGGLCGAENAPVSRGNVAALTNLREIMATASLKNSPGENRK